MLIVDERTAGQSRAAQNAMSTVTLAAHEICSGAYPDPVKQKDFLERASRDWLNSDYHVYMWMYYPYRPFLFRLRCVNMLLYYI